jgi:hypothetical protein
MPIPDRLRPPPPTAAEMAEYTELCRRIENRRYADEDELNDLLGRWNRRAGRQYKEVEFRSYHGAMEIDEFVTEMLLGEPKLVPDLTYSELRDVLEAVVSVSLPQPEESYFLGLLEANLPDSDICDLIYWPNEWFGDEALLHVELSPDQILAYAMKRCGRMVPGAPENVPLPYPIPPRTGA